MNDDIHYTQIETYETDTIESVARRLVASAPASCMFAGVEIQAGKDQVAEDIVRKYLNFRQSYDVRKRLKMLAISLNGAPVGNKITQATPVVMVLRGPDGGLKRDMPNPSEEEVGTPLFNAIYGAIRSWDVNAPEFYDGYCAANGSHAKLIMDAVAKVMAKDREDEAARIVKYFNLTSDQILRAKNQRRKK